MANCIHPFWKRKENLKPGEIAGPHPCGKCYPCVMRRLSGWHFRLKNELKYAQSAHFLTLTYETDFVPISSHGYLTVCKNDLQCFWKRLRRALYRFYPDHSPLRYYACGEYGGRFERPHYHAIAFNTTPELVDYCWQLGSIYIGDVTDESIGYVVGYSQKSFYAGDWDDGRAPPFSCMSKYLGLQYLTPEMYNWHKKDLDNRMYIPLDDGKKISMPRYFKDVIYDETERKRVAFYSAKRAEEEAVKRDEYMEHLYGERASEVKMEMDKQSYIKLQYKKQKRKL